MSSTDAEVNKEQGFLSHLIELRDRLLKMVLAVGLLFLGLFWFSQEIYTALASPLLDLLPNGQQMIAIGVAAPFFIPFKLTLMLCVFLAVPYLLYQIWSFVAPGLYTHEKRLVVPMLVSSTLLFYLGVAFAYFVVFPLVFGFFTSVAPEGVMVSPDIESYLDFVITLFFAFGIAFEVPVATVLVVAVGITTPENLVKIRPYVFVAAFIIGMFLTPPDMISQTLLAIPMWLLYEVGIVFSRIYKQRIVDAGLAREAKYNEDDEAEADADLVAEESANTKTDTQRKAIKSDADVKSSKSAEASTDAKTDASTSPKTASKSKTTADNTDVNDYFDPEIMKKKPDASGSYKNSLTDQVDDLPDSKPPVDKAPD